MKTFLLTLLLNLSILAQHLYTGGTVPVINKVSGIGVVNIDFSQSTSTPIASFTIDNNTPSFVLSIKFLNGAKFTNHQSNAFISPEELKISGYSGLLGQGITPLVDKNILPLSGNEFIWKPEHQQTATINYGLKITATWPAQRPLSGIYTETIITTITVAY